MSVIDENCILYLAFKKMQVIRVSIRDLVLNCSNSVLWMINNYSSDDNEKIIQNRLFGLRAVIDKRRLLSGLCFMKYHNTQRKLLGSSCRSVKK